MPPARLQVLPPNQKDKLKQAQQRKQQADLREAAFLEFSCPRPFLFEGETVAAKVSLFCGTGYQSPELNKYQPRVGLLFHDRIRTAC